MPEEVVRNDPYVYGTRPGIRVSEMIDRVSWGAIWAGVMAALGMEALFTLFGMFIGFGMYNPTAANPWSGVPAWSLGWYLVTAGWSMFFGAWCSARLSGDPLRSVGILHAIATWGLATLVTLAIVVLASWAVLREGIAVLGNLAVPVSPNTAVPGTAAQATVSDIAGIALRVWGGVLLGFITALFGGALGTPTNIATVREEVPAGTRRAA